MLIFKIFSMLALLRRFVQTIRFSSMLAFMSMLSLLVWDTKKDKLFAADVEQASKPYTKDTVKVEGQLKAKLDLSKSGLDKISAKKENFRNLLTKRRPSVGVRVYLIGGSTKLNPSTILPEQGAANDKGVRSKRYMKDPRKPDFKRQRLVVRRMKKPKAKGLKIKPVVLQLDRLPIKGNFTQPRVEFTREYLKVEMVDESVKKDFFGKMYEGDIDVTLGK